MLPVEAAARVLASNVNALLDSYPTKLPRPKMAAKIDIGDKTLGFLKSGSGNPTLESIVKVARFFKREPWELLRPAEPSTADPFAELLAMSTPRSRAALDAISRAASEGRLTEADLLLLQRIAQRFMGD